MKKNNIIYLRRSMEQIPTQRLEEMLQEELRKEVADDKKVRLILSVLEEREEDTPVEWTPKIDAAWNDYIEHTDYAASRPERKGNKILKVASFVAIVVVLFASFSQRVEAKGFFERLIRWSDSIFELLSPGEAKNEPAEYVFETDNPGLQQIYDAVVELGVTDPVVPMWLPEGYELKECKVVETPIQKRMASVFIQGDNEIAFALDIYNSNSSYKYYKDDTPVNNIELAGTTHSIMRNNDEWVVIWTRENLECSIAADCQEDTLHQILRSIYTMEDE